jgi:hypothetical protein
LVSTWVSAQSFGGGVYAGMTTSQINGDNLGGFNLPGANIGFFTDYKINETSSIQMELAFIQKGARELPSDTSNFYKVRLNYFEIPLLYVFRWKKLSIEVGPGFDFLLSSTEESNGLKFESNPPFHDFNVTGILGFNWHFTEKIHVNFRSNNSLDIIRDAQSNPGTGPNAIQIGRLGQRNIVLSFAVVYHFK